MKRLAVLVAAILCIALLAGCGDSGRNAVLTVWCAEDDKAMIEQMVSDFLSTKPPIGGVVVEICEDDKAREKFEEDPASAADVICIPHDQLGALVAAEYLLEITASKHKDAIGGNTNPSVKAGQIDGRQYGFPSSFETHMLFYNKLIISDEIARTLEGILSITGVGDGYPFAMDFGNAYFSANWFFTYGCRLFGENGEDANSCDFDNADGIAAMSYIIENRDKLGNFTADEAIDLLGTHTLGAFIGGPWNAAAVTETLKGNYGCTSLPSVAGKPMKSFAGFKLYCVNANTENKNVSLDLAAWLTNPDNQKTRFQERNLIPVSVSLSEDADVAASTTAKAVMGQGPNAIAMPSIPEMSNFWGPAGDFTLACYNGEIKTGALQGELSGLASEIRAH